MNLLQKLNWNSHEHSDEDNLRWSLLRAMEWGIWPAFLSGPIAPLLFPFFSWWKVIGIIVLLTIVWSVIRYHYVNTGMARLGTYFVLLKWVSCPLAAIYLIIHRNYILAALSLVWPGLAAFLGVFVGGAQIGKLQKAFMNKLGYSENR